MEEDARRRRRVGGGGGDNARSISGCVDAVTPTPFLVQNLSLPLSSLPPPSISPSLHSSLLPSSPGASQLTNHRKSSTRPSPFSLFPFLVLRSCFRIILFRVQSIFPKSFAFRPLYVDTQNRILRLSSVLSPPLSSTPFLSVFAHPRKTLDRWLIGNSTIHDRLSSSATDSCAYQHLHNRSTHWQRTIHCFPCISFRFLLSFISSFPPSSSTPYPIGCLSD